MRDLSWATKEAGCFDQSQFLINWQARQVLRVPVPLSVCRPCPLHAKCMSVAAKVLRLRPDEATNTALVAARKRQETPAFCKQANEQESKGRWRKPYAPVRCDKHAILASKNSGCKPFHGDRSQCVAGVRLAHRRYPCLTSCLALRSAGGLNKIGSSSFAGRQFANTI
jgi:hypothetical protein